jgi:hypothetical protein
MMQSFIQKMQSFVERCKKDAKYSEFMKNDAKIEAKDFKT